MRVPDLAAVLGPVPWAVVGAVAARMYMPERVTQDVDIAVSQADSNEAQSRLRAAGYVQQGTLAVPGSWWKSPRGDILDVLELEAPWAGDALRQAQQNRDAQGLPVMPLPYLVLMKFQSGRVQDLADITRMLGQADEAALDSVRRAFQQHAAGDLGDLEDLIRLGQLETRHPERDG